MNDQILSALTRLFEKKRVVFWYDEEKQLRKDFETLELVDVEKLELTNNEFGVKYRVLKEEPNQKFLLYREGPEPSHLDNWLLDVQLSNCEFRTDQIALWLSELELGIGFADVVKEHAEFYNIKKRRESLKLLLEPQDPHQIVRLKLLAVCTGAEARLDSILESLLAELSAGRKTKINLIHSCDLDGVLWGLMNRAYGYRSDTPSIKDFVIELFKSCYAMGVDGEVNLATDALVFLRRWKDSRRFEKSFEALSDECADILDIERVLHAHDVSKLADMDYFSLIDQKIISELVQKVLARTISTGDVALLVRQRRQSHWYERYQNLYEAVDFAAQFVSLLDEVSLDMTTMTDGIDQYAQSWFRLDQLYRKYTYHVRNSGQVSLMESLTEQIENLYSNNYLLKLNDRWQIQVDAIRQWDAEPVLLQKNFFDESVLPFLNKGKKVYVIISDALRYEIGDELLGLIRQEDRFDAILEPALSMLPSYTQLGMAALLPNKELAFMDGDSGTVKVDGKSSQGTSNRNKILNRATSHSGKAIQAETLMALNKDDSRALVRDHDVVYVYHNLIDKTGDSRDSEGRVFEAVEKTLEELIKIIKKLSSANASNLLLTADHGFIYQNTVLDESDYSSAVVKGEKIHYLDRRFVLGAGLKRTKELKTFTSSELGLVGNMEVHIPKSINRLRRKGSGSRFVHGGASLQEVVIPVIRINKKRTSDIAFVEVDILRGATSVITSGQLALVFYQAEPATDKIQPRTFRAGIFTRDGDLISDSHELVFDFISENPRERELRVRFVLSREADKANGQEVVLKLEEKVAGTSHFKEYKSLSYVVRRSFTTDFDF